MGVKRETVHAEIIEILDFEDVAWFESGNSYFCVCDSEFYGLKFDTKPDEVDIIKNLDQMKESEHIANVRASKLRKFIVGAQKFGPDKFVIKSNGSLSIQAYAKGKGFNSKYRLSRLVEAEFRHSGQFDRIQPLKKFKRGEVELKKHRSGPMELGFTQYEFSFLLL